MFELLHNAGAEYLEELLRAAMRGESARSEPVAGGFVATLMVALVARGEADRVDQCLRCTQGQPSVYEVTCFGENHRAVSRIEGLDVGQAISIATRFAAARPNGTAAVIALDDTGHQRCVLLAQGPMLSYQFGEGDEFDGDILASAGTFELVSEPGSAAEQLHSVPSAIGDSTEAAAVEELAQSVDSQLRGDLSALGTQNIAVLLGSLIPCPEDIADLVVRKFSDRSDF